MRLYSQTIVSFIERLEAQLKQILINEVRLPVRRTRFEFHKRLYPINIVVFEHPKILGHFRPEYYEIGINRNLLFTARDKIIHDILRHELAHYLCWIQNREDQQGHDEYFRQLCKSFGWDESIYSATLDIAQEQMELSGDLQSERLIARLQKLMSLASSDNPHEAEQATLKANQLILQHNLNFTQSNPSDETVWVDSVLSGPKQTAKLVAICDILQHFMVKPILSFGHHRCSIEVTGLKANVEFAQYVAHYLDLEFESLWKKQHNLKGLRAKNSFFLGLSKGFSAKMKQEKEKLSPADQKTLLVIDSKLSDRLEWVYPHLRQTSSSTQIDLESLGQGQKAGSQLSIRRPLQHSSEVFLLN